MVPSLVFPPTFYSVCVTSTRLTHDIDSIWSLFQSQTSEHGTGSLYWNTSILGFNCILSNYFQSVQIRALALVQAACGSRRWVRPLNAKANLYTGADLYFLWSKQQDRKIGVMLLAGLFRWDATGMLSRFTSVCYRPNRRHNNLTLTRSNKMVGDCFLYWLFPFSFIYEFWEFRHLYGSIHCGLICLLESDWKNQWLWDKNPSAAASSTAAS